jgi:hypothetical protein
MRVTAQVPARFETTDLLPFSHMRLEALQFGS